MNLGPTDLPGYLTVRLRVVVADGTPLPVPVTVIRDVPAGVFLFTEIVSVDEPVELDARDTLVGLKVWLACPGRPETLRAALPP